MEDLGEQEVLEGKRENLTTVSSVSEGESQLRAWFKRYEQELTMTVYTVTRIVLEPINPIKFEKCSPGKISDSVLSQNLQILMLRFEKSRPASIFFLEH